MTTGMRGIGVLSVLLASSSIIPVRAATNATAVDLRARWEAYRPYDGDGRYTSDRDDGVRGIQGLTALAARFGAKPYAELSLSNGAWLAERTIFRDVDTGATILRLTHDRWTDQLSYFHGNWSADGRCIVWRRKPGMWEGSTATHGPMAMNADGTGLRNVFRDFPMVRGEICSPVEPGVCYAMSDTDRKVLAFDLATGRQRQVVRQTERNWHLKVSPDGRYLMSRAVLSTGVKGLWIAGVDGREFHEIPIPEAIHDSYCFVPGCRKIMFWYEGKFRDEGFVECDFDGANRTNVMVLYDWNHGDFGLDRGVHTEGGMTRLGPGSVFQPLVPLFHKPGVEYYDDPADANGYSAWSPKDVLWSYHTRILRRPHISEIFAAACEPAPDGVVNRYRVCYTALWRGGSLLDNPNASPDGTKVLFNANSLGAGNIFCVVARLPERPVAVRAEAAASGVRLTWQPSRHHAETAGYHIYRSSTGGAGFAPVTDKPVLEAAFTDATGGRDAVYTVTAIEHSGLESGLSDEASAARTTPRTVWLEAEDAALSPQMWIAFQGLAGDLHYIWKRTREGAGTAVLTVAHPPAGACRVWCRVKGPAGAAFTLAVGRQQPLALHVPASSAWSWVRAEGAVAFDGSAATLTIASDTYGSALDSIVLSDDPQYTPPAAGRVVWPALPAVAGVTAQALSPYAVRLAWTAPTGATCHHVNVYAGSQPDFEPDQSALVGSPDGATLVDWGLRPGATVYYRLAAVDRAGNEGPPCAAVMANLPAIEPFRLETAFSPSLTFDVPAKATYAVWLKLRRVEGAQGSYVDVKVDGQGGGSWVGSPDGLADAYWLNYDQWGRFDLAPGPHTLTVGNKSGQTIEKVLIASDLSFTPPGHVNLLAGW